MGKLISSVFLTIFLLVWMGGFVLITATLVGSILWNVLFHFDKVTAAGYCSLLFVIYSAWLCYMIVRRMNKKATSDVKPQEESVRRSFVDTVGMVWGYFWVCMVVVALNAVAVCGSYACAHSVVTMVSGEPYQSEVVAVKVGKARESSHRHSRSRGHRGSSRSGPTYTAVVRFHTKEGHILERDLYYFSAKNSGIGTKLVIHYSPLTDDAVFKSFGSCCVLVGFVLVTLLLSVLAFVVSSYAIIGCVPKPVVIFWNKIRIYLLYGVLFLALIVMTCLLGYIVIRRLLFDDFGHVPGFAVAICGVFFFGCVLGGIGLARYMCMQGVPSKNRRGKLKSSKSRKRLVEKNAQLFV